MARHYQVHLSDPATLLMVQLSWLYDFAMGIGVFVLFVVFGSLLYVTTNSLTCRNIYEARRLEVAWTLIPAGLLSCLAVPSIRLLYAMDEMVDPIVTVKAVGHQWYWSYEYGDMGNFEFDSYMLPLGELSEGDLRLLEVDNRLVLPFNEQIRMLITSADVIHSWAVPALAIKVDGLPGRMNQAPILIARPGVFRGMCSELCGVNHGFMPIVIEAVSMSDFLSWGDKLRSLSEEE